MLPIAMKRGQALRYGENPHQQAALYLPVGPHGRGIAQAEQVQGKELSYNNYNDADAALELVSEFRGDGPACVIVKHANPCGVARGESLVDAYEKAFACDTVSAFGGIIAVNAPLTRAAAEAMTQIFTEVVIAPDADAEPIVRGSAQPALAAASSAFQAAMRADSSRFICPAPMPAVAPSLA